MRNYLRISKDLAKEQYEALLKNQNIDENASKITQLNNDIATIVSNNLYVVTIERIKNLSTQYSSLSSSEKN